MRSEVKSQPRTILESKFCLKKLSANYTNQQHIVVLCNTRRHSDKS